MKHVRVALLGFALCLGCLSTPVAAADDSACKEPARSIVVNGGKFTAVYEYPNRSSFLKRTVESC